MLTRILLGILYTATGISILATLTLHNHARITCHWNWESSDSFMRMVVFADPQMEGDAKIRRLGKRAHVDLAFNDAFMRHIYKKMMSPSWEPLAYLSSFFSSPSSTGSYTPRSPTHVSILGDLFSSQWIDDTEFEVRVARYRSIFPDPSISTALSGTGSSGPIMINITGNHDIGYGYDISQYRVERWEQVFGRSNFISTMDIPTAHGAAVGINENDTESWGSSAGSRKLHLVVLNTMLLDGPSSDENLRGQTWEFLQEASSLKQANPQDKIVLLTHIPFHKEQGVCVDPPDIRVHSDNTIIEQTMLTPNTTQWILNNLRPDFVLNGHDHYGCDVTHILAHDQETWTAFATTDLSSPTSLQEEEGQVKQQQDKETSKKVREVTQRSMMAEFGGYSGLFEIKTPVFATSPENNSDELEFHYTACGFFNDLQVWVVIITDLIVLGLWSLLGLAHLISSTITTMSSGQARRKTNPPSEKQKLL
ncbi:hypothetical protein EC991_002986 [Linnemannia zychae]|nr:hypothetical protein EC991_002986 [Linnemannia zychae]